MSSILYRPAVPGDIPSLAGIRAINRGTQEYWNDRITGYMEYRVNPQRALKPRILYTALADELIIGFIAGHLTQRFDCDGELEFIDTLEAFRRKGVATNLVNMLAKWFIDQGAYNICVDPGNEIARIFYKKNGAEMLNKHWIVWKDIRNLPDPVR
jgi:GNAT superfamily N-acetyltransferase